MKRRGVGAVRWSVGGLLSLSVIELSWFGFEHLDAKRLMGCGDGRMRLVWRWSGSWGDPCSSVRSDAEDSEPGEVDRGGEELEVGVDFDASADAGASSAVSSSHQMPEFAFDFGVSRGSRRSTMDAFVGRALARVVLRDERS